jgi:plasmid replication initiation protein
MNIVKIEDNKNNIVIKHKDLVWEARYRLSELSIKVISVLISMIKINDNDFKQYALKVSDFKELIDSNSKNTYKYTHKIINELLSKTLKIGDEQFAWISYGKYVEGSDIIIFEINRHLRPYLLKIQSKFLEYNIINILPLKSSYVIRLYELFKSKYSEYKHYNKNTKSFTFELKIDWLREHLEIPRSYQYSSHIKKLIIDKAKKEFKQKTDISFDYKEQKIGRKVDRLIITIKENYKGSNDFLRSKRAFIAYMRKNYINANIVKTRDKYTNKEILVSIAEDGTLYNKKDTTKIKAKRADEMWEALYKFALSGQINLNKID